MVQVSTIAGSTRIIQLLFSIISLALNGKLTQNNSSLSSLVFDLNSLANSTLYIAQDKASSGVSLASSGFTLTSQSVLSGIRYFTTNIEHDLSDLNTARFGINKKQSSYLTGISGTELGSVSLWFGTFVYQTSKYGGWDCGNPEKLVIQYNLTGNALSDGLGDFLGINDGWGNDESLSNTTTSNDEINELLGQLWNLTLEPINISKYNFTGELTKSQLIVQLSQDCYIKKASIGVSFMMFVGFLVSSGVVSFTFVKLRMALYSKLVANSGNDEEKKSEQEGSAGTGTDEQGGVGGGHDITQKKKYRFLYSFANIFPDVEFDE